MLLIKQDGLRTRRDGGEKSGFDCEYMCLCFRVRVDERGMLNIRGVFLAPQAGLLQQRLMVVLILVSPAPLCLCCGPICERAGRQEGGLFVM